MRPAWAEIDLDAVAHNVRALDAWIGPSALCAVVKADGYGHGSIEVSRAALAAGATGLAVALVEEGLALREAGIDEPILVLSEATPAQVLDLVAGRLTPTVYTHQGIEAVAKAVAELEASGVRDPGLGPHPLQVKVDTGMHRVGADPADVVELVRAVAARPEVSLGAVWSHCAVADEPGHPFTEEQLVRFDQVCVELAAAGLAPSFRHLANSAAAIAHPATRLDQVRCGIAIYGLDPAPALADLVDLRPALSLKSNVTFVHAVPAGEGSCYGLRRRFDHEATVATVPIGYADGVWRAFWEHGEVLIGGVRRRLAGTVTMDQIVVDCTDGPPVAAGDEVVLIGRQGDDEISAQEWAELLGTITYEIVCGIGARVPRTYIGGTQPEPARSKP